MCCLPELCLLAALRWVRMGCVLAGPVCLTNHNCSSLNVLGLHAGKRGAGKTLLSPQPEQKTSWIYVQQAHHYQAPVLWPVPKSAQLWCRNEALGVQTCWFFLWSPVNIHTPTGLVWHILWTPWRKGPSVYDYFEIFCSLRLSTDSTSLLPLPPLILHDRVHSRQESLRWNSCQWECFNLLSEDTAHPSPPTRGRPYRLLPPPERELIKAGVHIYSCVLLCISNCLMHSEPCTDQVLGLKKELLRKWLFFMMKSLNSAPFISMFLYGFYLSPIHTISSGPQSFILVMKFTPTHPHIPSEFVLKKEIKLI